MVVSVDDKGRLTVRGVYQKQVCEMVRESWEQEGSVEEKWTSVKSALCKSAELVLGKAKRRQPDWYQESSAVLQPLIEERNRLVKHET